MLPFKFIVVESRLGSHSPAMLYECTNNDMRAGLYGGVCNATLQYCKGIYELLEDYRWHKTHDKWQLPRLAYENNGIISLNVFQTEELSSDW